MSVDCLILGDSIAVGIGQDRPACVTVARVGVTSSTFVQTLLRTAPTQARTIVISLGVNDGASAATADMLRRMRGSVTATRVTWLLPGPKEEVRRAIRTVAAEYGDRLIDTGGDLGPDHLHPTGAGVPPPGRVDPGRRWGAHRVVAGGKGVRAYAGTPFRSVWQVADDHLPGAAIVHAAGHAQPSGCHGLVAACQYPTSFTGHPPTKANGLLGRASPAASAVPPA